MTQDEVINWATENNLDVRQIHSSHYRLMNEYGEYVVDVYFKHNKRGEVVKNKSLQWRSGRWKDLESLEDLRIWCS